VDGISILVRTVVEVEIEDLLLCQVSYELNRMLRSRPDSEGVVTSLQ